MRTTSPIPSRAVALTRRQLHVRLPADVDGARTDGLVLDGNTGPPPTVDGNAGGR